MRIKQIKISSFKRLITIIIMQFISTNLFALTIVDMAQREITIPKKIEKVIALGPGALRLLVYLQAQDLIVGVEEMEKKNPDGRPYWIASPQLHSLPTISPGGPQSINQIPNLEKIIQINPDIIFVIQMDKNLADKIQERIKKPVIVLSYGLFASFDTKIYDSIKLVGKILKKEKRSDEIIKFIKNIQNDLNQRSKTTKHEGCVYIGGIGFKGGHGIESSDATYIPLEWINANNCSKRFQKKGHIFLTKEQILTINPDIIFIDGNGNKLVEVDKKRNPRFYDALKAYNQNRVYNLLPFNWYSTNVEIALLNSYIAGKKLYPKAFQDIDIKSIATKIYVSLLNCPTSMVIKLTNSIL